MSMYDYSEHDRPRTLTQFEEAMTSDGKLFTRGNDLYCAWVRWCIKNEEVITSDLARASLHENTSRFSLYYDEFRRRKEHIKKEDFKSVYAFYKDLVTAWKEKQEEKFSLVFHNGDFPAGVLNSFLLPEEPQQIKTLLLQARILLLWHELQFPFYLLNPLEKTFNKYKFTSLGLDEPADDVLTPFTEEVTLKGIFSLCDELIELEDPKFFLKLFPALDIKSCVFCGRF